MTESHYVRPDLEHVGAVGVIHHIGRETAARTHIDLQCHDIALFAQTLVFCKTEKLEMHESVFDLESFQRSSARVLNVSERLVYDIENAVVVVVDYIH